MARATYNDEMGSSCSSHCVGGILVREGQVPVCAREAAEGADEGEEDHEEDDVGAEGADEEDEADESYPYTCQSFCLSSGARVEPDAPMKRRKNAKLALNAGVCNPSGFPGFPSCPAICAGVVT